MKRLPTLLRIKIACTLVLWSLCLSPLTHRDLHAQQPPRLVIKLSNYSGEPPEAFEQFYNILKNKIKNMVFELSTRESQGFDYLLELEIDRTGVDAPPTLAAKLDYWKRAGALALLEGVIFQSGAAETTIVSTADLGELGKELPKRAIDLELKVTPTEFRTTRDGHSLTTLYALAMDAKRLKMSDHIVIELLSKAYSISQDLDATHLPDIQLLKKEIKTMLEGLKSSGGSSP